MMRKPFLLCLVSLLALSSVWAQAPSSIWMIKWNAKKTTTQGKAKIIVDNNLYNNQPSFYDNHLCYTQINEGNADIMIYHMEDGSTTNFTKTSNRSEYSAHIAPDGKHITTITVEEDGTQRLWNNAIEAKDTSYPVFEDIKPVGYFTWFADMQVGMFVLGNPQTLVVGNPETGKSKTFDQNIGRSFWLDPNDENSFLYIKNAENESENSLIMRYNNGITSKYAELPKNTADFTVTPNGGLLTGVGGALWYLSPSQNEGWVKIVDYSDKGVKDISRMDFSPDGKHLAIVVHP